MMPYSDRLRDFGAWFAQLWAESLGKGGEGTTPVPAVGPVDQHSQLQLFMDGPRGGHAYAEACIHQDATTVARELARYYGTRWQRYAPAGAPQHQLGPGER